MLTLPFFFCSALVLCTSAGKWLPESFPNPTVDFKECECSFSCTGLFACRLYA